ncbi:MAG: DUF429 domain-containing protein [Candidatus Micrarchaeia archaeon]
MKNLVFCGIDLAAKEKNPTGIAFIDLKGRVIEETIMFSDRDIIRSVLRIKPRVIAIDAPLSFPIDDNMREEEKTLRKEGYNIFPFFDSMKLLAKRGIEIDKMLDAFTVIEVCPSISAKILGIQREKNKLRRHIEDAKIAAITAKLFYEGKCNLISGRFYIPRKDNDIK